MKPFSRSYPVLKSTSLFLLLLGLPCLLSAQLNISISATNVSCWGAADGQAAANTSGGVPPYTYIWSNNSPMQTISNLGPGTYSVTVGDAGQNTKSASIVITQPAKIALSMASSAQVCNAAPDGAANCIAYAGIPPYTYLWSNNKTTQQIQHLTAGTYSITVTDMKNCSATKTVAVNDATSEGLWTSLTVHPTTCNYDDGTAHISIMSGTAPYQYLWSNGGTGTNIEDLPEGSYTVSVNDVNGCSTTASALIVKQELLVESQVTFATCGFMDGTAEVSSTAGTPPYQYIWSNGVTMNKIDSLAAGIYTAIVTDAVGCSGTETAYVSTNGSILITGQLMGPKCLNKIAAFTHEAPPLYPDILWSLNDTLDQIILGQGTDSIEVKWNSTGHKVVVAHYGINGVSCGGYGFIFDVFVCAETNDPALTGAVASPNPFSDYLQIVFPNNPPSELEAVLTDISGKIMLRKDLDNPIEHLQSAHLPAGMYFLKVRSGKGIRVWKLTKQ